MLREILSASVALVFVSFASTCYAQDRNNVEMSGHTQRRVKLYPTKKLLDNYTYELKVGHYGFMAKLANGKFDLPGVIKSQIREQALVTGDFNGDGLTDAAVQLGFTAGMESESTLKVLINNGNRFVDCGTIYGGSKRNFQNLKFSNGKIIFKMNDFSKPIGTSQADCVVRVISKQFMTAKTFVVENKKLRNLGNSSLFFDKFESQSGKFLQDNLKTSGVRAHHFDDLRRLPPTVLVLNDPDSYIKHSSGNAGIDCLAYEAIDYAVRELPVRCAFVDSHVPLECRIDKGSVTCKEISKPQNDSKLDDITAACTIGQKLDNVERAQLERDSKRGSSKWFRAITSKQFKLSNGIELTCEGIARGDFNSDRKSDLVVWLKASSGLKSDRLDCNLIVPLANSGGHFELLPQLAYCLGTGDFMDGVDVVAAGTNVKSIVVKPGKIDVVCEGRLKSTLDEKDINTNEQSVTANRYRATAPFTSTKPGEIPDNKTILIEITTVNKFYAQEQRDGKISPLGDALEQLVDRFLLAGSSKTHHAKPHTASST